MIVDIHVHVGELDKHFSKWWIDELYAGLPNVPNKNIRYVKDPVGRLISELDRVGVDKACIIDPLRDPYSARQGLEGCVKE